MPDISMCSNEECPSKDKCYRYVAIPDEYWQSYGAFSFDVSGKCSYFMEARSKSQFRRLDVVIKHNE